MNQDPNIIAAIDIGTTKIVALVGRKLASGRIELLGIEKVTSTGVKRGVVLNIDETANAIMEVISRIQMRLGMRLSDIYVGIAGQHIKSMLNKSYRFIDPPYEIKQSDVDSLYHDNFKIPIEAGEQVLHVIPMDFVVDNESGIKVPSGMAGRKLEGNFHIVLGQQTSVRNIEKCIHRVGVLLNDMILEPLASARSVLTEEEKEAGVVVVDIGGGTTDVAIFYDNVIRHTAVIPFGGNAVTSDIKEGCGVLYKHAESLKVQFGSAIGETEREEDVVAIPGMPGWEPREISLNLLGNIIQARMEEIIDFVSYEIENSGFYDKLGAGIVLTGGGADLRNLPELFKYRTGLDVRVGRPDLYIDGAMFHEIYSPRFSTSLGLLLSAMDRPVKKTVEPKLFPEHEMEKTEEATKASAPDKMVEKDKPRSRFSASRKEGSKKRLELTGNLFDSIKDGIVRMFDDKVEDTDM
jgi:cell division protein FtsA